MRGLGFTVVVVGDYIHLSCYCGIAVSRIQLARARSSAYVLTREEDGTVAWWAGLACCYCYLGQSAQG